MNPFRYFVGKRTKAFDVLEQNLMVVESATGVCQSAAAEMVRGDSTTALTPYVDNVKNGNGCAAFLAEEGKIYRVEGVEYVPTKVVKYVQLVKGVGFKELTPDEAMAAMAPAVKFRGDLPPLSGTEDQVKWADRIRQSVAEHFQQNHPELVPLFKMRHFAGWYITRKTFTFEQWATEFRSINESFRKKS